MADGKLTDRLRHGPLPSMTAARYGRQIAQALDHAHRRGVVHCDVKPDNILIESNDAKLADFGVARSPNPSDNQSSLITQRYAAPEQLAGAEASQESDIYTLALVIIEMISGKLPESVESVDDRLLAGMDEETVATFRQALHHDRRKRCQSVMDLAKACSRN